MNSKQGKGRPPLAPEDAETRKRLIQVGLAYLTERGFSSVGVNEIIREANVPKGCFYHYFKSKVDFGMHLLDAYDQYFSRKLDHWFQDETLTPLDRIRAFMADAEEGMRRFDFRRGCLVGNLGQEMGALPEEFRSKLILVFDRWEKKTADCLSQAQALSQVSKDRDFTVLASFFWIGWEGAVLRAKLCRNADPLHTFAEEFLTSISTNKN